MYLYGSIEQAGTGTEMIVEKCLEHGLKMPEFQQDDTFRLIFWRKTEEENTWYCHRICTKKLNFLALYKMGIYYILKGKRYGNFQCVSW